MLNNAEAQLRPLRTTLIEKLQKSYAAWDGSVKRFRALHWMCLTGVILVPTCLASLKHYMSPLTFDLLSVLEAIFGSVQAIVRPSDKFMRDIEFRDEANYLLRLVQATEDPTRVKRLMERFERVERRFHQGASPWAIPKHPGSPQGKARRRLAGEPKE